MFNVKVSGERTNGVVKAKVSMSFPDKRYSISISDIYPGGLIQYVRDPGFAQIWCRVMHMPAVDRESRQDQEVTVEASRDIPDNYHDEIEVKASFNGELLNAHGKITENSIGFKTDA